MLELDAAAHRDQDIVVGAHPAQETAIPDAGPAAPDDCINIVADELEGETFGQVLVKKDAHRPGASRRPSRVRRWLLALHRRTLVEKLVEGIAATHWTRLSCHRFRANEVRLLLGVIAYHVGNLLRRLVLPFTIQNWSLTSLHQRLFKTGGRLIRHARYYILQLAESRLTRRLFGQILGRNERLEWHPI